MSGNIELSEKAQLGKKLTGEFVGEEFYSEILKNMLTYLESCPSNVQNPDG